MAQVHDAVFSLTFCLSRKRVQCATKFEWPAFHKCLGDDQNSLSQILIKCYNWTVPKSYQRAVHIAVHKMVKKDEISHHRPQNFIKFDLGFDCTPTRGL